MEALKPIVHLSRDPAAVEKDAERLGGAKATLSLCGLTAEAFDAKRGFLTTDMKKVTCVRCWGRKKLS